VGQKRYPQIFCHKCIKYCRFPNCFRWHRPTHH